ncbi:MAG: CHAT domain-containing protein, partial [Phaeodactylibacter sp.]|nr:CHAT domain-containing protein [Phaeodactylibacter sp.]
EDSVIYAALVLKPGAAAPQLIRLFEESELSALIYQDDLASAQRLETMYASRGGRPKQQALPPKGLYEIIWQALEPELEDIKQIYFATSGVLHRINIGALASHKKDLLSEQFEMTRLNSTRQLAIQEEAGEERRGALLFGGITYDPDGSMGSAEDSPEGAWRYLDWTQREVAGVREILVEAGVPAFIKAKDEASEAVFKTLGKENPVPRILHLATHGFFFPDPELQSDSAAASTQLPSFAQNANPMLRSGLILAGANEAWTGGTVPEGQEDGILTAYEISQMNLKGTELVVLSACETGLGDIEGNEGVYGLQRAFKMAGVHYLILSLWQVPDKETMEFMNTFYSHWLEDEKSIPEAFRLTQKKISNQYENPFWWAGFILIQ